MANSAAVLDLALVIPTWNDAEGLSRLLRQAADMGCFAEVIVVDDGSDIPVCLPGDSAGVKLLRHTQPHGPGVARNSGLAAVTAPYVLFFDADDLLTGDLPDLSADLADELRAGRAFDFCLFRHADSRVAAEERWGQPVWDEALWQQAGLSVAILQAPPAKVWPVLARTANYPWNKIYRTAFLHDNGIGLGETLVHEDVVLHWLGFLAAKRVLVSTRTCAWHRVSRQSGRLTNLRGPERLQIFAPLQQVVTAMATADPIWLQSFATFALGLVDWNASIIVPPLRVRLRAREADFLRTAMAGWPQRLESTDPALARHLTTRMKGAG